MSSKQLPPLKVAAETARGSCKLRTRNNHANFNSADLFRPSYTRDD